MNLSFNIGDKVAVIDDVIKGKVVAVYPHKIVVETSDEFSFEFSPNELVLIKSEQSELSKYSDIKNENLLKKKDDSSSLKNKPKFKSAIKQSKLPPMVVDLHIHQLTSSTSGMDTYDILNLQVDTAKHKLEFAIKNNIQKIVFIHGVGAGVLKTELAFLFKKYKVETYAASFKEFGLGATEVYIYQNPKN
jgi:dsDNA-specific endonuclease/ATPase MutS2